MQTVKKEKKQWKSQDKVELVDLSVFPAVGLCSSKYTACSDLHIIIQKCSPESSFSSFGSLQNQSGVVLTQMWLNLCKNLQLHDSFLTSAFLRNWFLTPCNWINGGELHLCEPMSSFPWLESAHGFARPQLVMWKPYGRASALLHSSGKHAPVRTLTPWILKPRGKQIDMIVFFYVCDELACVSVILWNH